MNRPAAKRPYGLMLLIAAQALCAAFFLADVTADVVPLGWTAFLSYHIAIEAIAALGLITAIVVETRYLFDLLRRQAHLEHQVSVASMALHDVVEAHFDAWGLTPSEADIAHFTVKGASIAEIATYRGSPEGTVKSHLNAIYRKAGVANRGELLSLLIEDLAGSRDRPETPPPALVQNA